MQNDFHTEVTDCVATGTVLKLVASKFVEKTVILGFAFE